MSRPPDLEPGPSPGVGERKRDEGASSADGEPWRAIVDLSPDAIFIHAGAGILFANPAMVAMMGAASADELLGMEALEVPHPDCRDAIRENRAAMAESGEPLAFQELRYRRLDGSDVWVEAAGAVIQWNDERAFMVMAHDIADRKRAEQALSESEARYRGIVDDQTELIARSAPDGVLTFVNDAYCRYFGKERGKLLGTSLLNHAAGEDEALVVECLGSLGPGNTAVSFEHRVIDGDGQVRWTEWSDRALFDDEGRLVEVQAVGRDITVEKEAEIALRASEEKFAKAFNASPNSVIITRVADSVVVDANDEYLGSVGLRREEVVGKPVTESVEWVVPEDRQRYRDLLAEKGECTDFPADFRVKDGKIVNTLITARTMEIDGEACILNITRNITARVQAEAALRTSETRFRDFEGSASDWLWETGVDLGITWVSQSYWEHTDQTEDQVFGRRPWEISGLRKVDREKPTPLQLKMEVHEPFQRFRYSRVDRSGQILYRSIAGWPVFGDDGAFQGYRGTISDVTAEVEIERGYRRLVESSPTCLLVQDGKTILFANNAAATVYRAKSPEDLVGRPVIELIHPDEHERYLQRLDLIGKDRRPLEVVEQRRIALDGAEIIVETCGMPIVWRGKPAIMGAQTDITDRRIAEEALRRSEQRIRGIMDNVADGVATIDEGGIIQTFNRIAEEIFGYAADEMIGRNVSILVPEPDRSRHDGYIKRFLETGESKILSVGPREVAGLRKDGSVFPIELSIAEMAHGGKRTFIGAMRDITEQKQTADKLRQAQKMEAVGQLTGGVAHDFNNLLAVIMGNLQLIESRIEGEADLEKLAHTALTATRRGAALTRQLLSYARQQPLQPETIDLNGFIDDMHGLLSTSLGERHEIKLIKAQPLWTTLADPAQVQTAILNLLINAGQAMPDGGTVIIETGNADFTGGDAPASDMPLGDYVYFSVSDTGVGMSPEVLDRAFDPFFTTKEVGQGSGLGLSMVYGFAKQSGGGVKIDSAEGKGSAVTLYLPRVDGHMGAGAADAKKAEQASELSRWGGDETVLVVEDNAEVREVAIQILSNLGYRILEAEDGPEAIRLAEAEPTIDALFTDMVLPHGMTGADIAAELRRVRADIKVLITSGNTQFDGNLDAGPVRDFDFLRKPYLAGDLALKLRALLDGERATP